MSLEKEKKYLAHLLQRKQPKPTVALCVNFSFCLIKCQQSTFVTTNETLFEKKTVQIRKRDN